MSLAAPLHTGLSAADRRALAEQSLRWASEGGIADFGLVKDPSHLIVLNAHLQGVAALRVPQHTVTLLPPRGIQARADAEGDFLYFRFDRISGDAHRAQVFVALIWAVSAKSTEHYLSGGGATLEFEKRDGRWQLLPVTERWMS